jgi:uncharacterized membrane protein (UPF0127 family)
VKARPLYKQGAELITWVEGAYRMHERMRGLLGKRGLPRGQALHISPCNAIHTMGMRFTLDVAFLDRQLVVIRVVRGLRPWRMATGGPGAASVLEMESGWLDDGALKVGDPLSWEANDGD